MSLSNAMPGRNLWPRLPMATDTLLALLSVFWALTANRSFLSGARDALQGGVLRLAGLLAVLALSH